MPRIRALRRTSKWLYTGVALAALSPTLAFAQAYSAGNGTATGANAVAIGSGSIAAGNVGVAIGQTANASQAGAISIGGNTQATQPGATALGNASSATGNSATAIGAGTSATGQNATAIGFGAAATGTSITSVGDSAGIGTGAGSVGNSNFGFVSGQNVTGNYNSGLGASAGQYVTGNFNTGVGAGAGTFVTGDGNYAGGLQAGQYVQGNANVAIGYNAGNGTSTTPLAVSSTIAIGSVALAGANNAVAIGRQATANGVNAFAGGSGTTANGASSVAIGDGASATYVNSIALGAGSATGAAAPTGAGFLTNSAAPASEVSIGAVGATRRLTNVADGSAATDAVTVAQLTAENSKVDTQGTSSATNLGGGSIYNATTGAVSAPIYTIGGSSYGNVGSAFGAVNTIVGSQGGSIATQLGGGATYNAATGTISGGSYKAGSTGGTYADVADALANIATGSGVDADAVHYTDGSHTAVVLGNTGAAPVALGNLADGNVAAGSHDAVNGEQLFTTNTNVTNLTNGITAGTIGLVRQVGGAPGAGIITVGAATGGTVINVSGTSGTRSVTGVTAAGLSATSTDAVNGSQLFATNGNVATAQATANRANAGVQAVANSLGGGTSYNPVTGAYTAGTYKAGSAGGTYATVADALANITSGGAGSDTNAVHYDDATRQKVTLTGAGGTTLTNVKAGTISSTSTDAVNGSQLAQTNANVTANTYSINALNTGITNGTIGLVQQVGGAPGNGQITVGASTGGTSVSIAGTSGNRVLSGVAAGVATTDAVNVGQLTAAIGGVTASGVQYDSPAHTSVTLNSGGTAAGLHNVAAGVIATGSTDGVNGGQLAATNQQVAANTAGIAGNTIAISTNTANIAGNTVAITALNNGTAGPFRSNNSSGRAAPVTTGNDAVAGGFGAQAVAANSTALGNGASATGVNSVALGFGSSDGGRANVVSVGGSGSERQIANVAAGTRPTDAVNLSQLTSGMAGTLSSANAYTDSRFGVLNYDLARARRDAASGTASAMAMASLPQAFTPGAGMLAGGISAYRDQTAFAFGASKAFNDGHTIVKANGTVDTHGTAGVAVGAGYQF